MYIFGGFQGTMLNDMLTYTPGNCHHLTSLLPKVLFFGSFNYQRYFLLYSSQKHIKIFLECIQFFVIGDCSAYKNKTSCFQASSSYGCARDVNTDTCIGPLLIPSQNPSNIERHVCPGN